MGREVLGGGKGLRFELQHGRLCLSASLYVTQRARTVPVVEEEDERAQSETSSPARPPPRTRGTKKEAKQQMKCGAVPVL